jgi:hypothetical protein
MEAWMIGILIVGAVIAIGFNIWNRKNPVGEKKKKTKLNLSPSPNQRPPTEEEKQQTERVLDMFKDKEGQNNKKKDAEGELYDSDGKRIN